MKNLEFNITKRDEKVNKVRHDGEIPCILYGQNLDKSISAKITKREMINILNYTDSSILNLNLNGDIKKCVIKELQRDPFGNIIHIDFQCIKKGETIKLKVPVNFIGQEGLESRRLLIEDFISEIPLQGEASEIPQNIEINVSELEYGDQILVKDINIPKSVKADINEELMIAKIGSVNTNEGEKSEKDEDANIYNF
ncbi:MULTISPECIES: 50S ribosomal protein L25 [unclassified Romboutsia]|uniref:50S ribosomal protein L25 n=1 Tax=unclassified Romboutsia TaxID=2626894 RepID=UPI000821BBC1|nr:MULTISPECIES: 50S ribosomal protein L25 [unclassified Romboutsia]SCI30071.1 General stress protein CTC [uncultured Clostridium sp.]